MTDTERFIRDTAEGLARIEEEDGYLALKRFTAKQQEAYRPSLEFYRKADASSGIVLRFSTDALYFSFRYRVGCGSSRRFYYFDLYCDGVLYDHTGRENVALDDAAQCEGRYAVTLPEGKKDIELYFPVLMSCAVKDLSLTYREDETGITASFSPIKSTLRGLAYGDSITHGYDAVYPSLSYPSILSRRFHAEIFNKAIGGDVHNADVLFADDFAPDFITVAYGTNDWSLKPSRKALLDGVDVFYRRLTSLYPAVPIFTVTPLWRADYRTEKPTGDFREAIAEMKEHIGAYPQVHIIDGWYLTPHDPFFYSDKRLHPNDTGFLQYAALLGDAMISSGAFPQNGRRI